MILGPVSIIQGTQRKRGQVYEKKDPAVRIHGNNSSFLPPKGSVAILLGNYILGKGEYLNILGLLNTGSKIALIFGYMKQHLGIRGPGNKWSTD